MDKEEIKENKEGWGAVKGLRASRRRFIFEDFENLTICDICGCVFMWDNVVEYNDGIKKCPNCEGNILPD